MKRFFGFAVLICVMSSVASADIVQQYGPGGVNSGLVNSLLGNLGIPQNASSETTAETFTVLGSGLQTIDLGFTQRRDTGSFQFNFGFFEVSSVSGINPVTQKEQWATAALANATLVFNDSTSSPGSTATLQVMGGTTLGFFLIPNNTLANFNNNPGAFYPSQTSNNALRSPLFSISNANPGEFDQMLSFIGNGQTLFTFEDLTRTGFTDRDYTDLGFTVDQELIGNVVPEPGSLALFSLGTLGIAVIQRRRSRRRS